MTVNKQNLTARLDNLAVNATSIEFYVVKNDKKKYKSGKAIIKTKSASWSCKLATGAEYKVRCRSWKGNIHSAWSDYSSSVLSTPAAPKGIKALKATSTTSITLSWYPVTKCTKYEVQYVTNKSYFDSNPDQVHTRTVENVVHTELTGLESGYQYFFRVRAYNTDDQMSAWTGIKSLKLGKLPAAPTTWSSTTTATVGETVTLYWVHNSEDNSSQTYAQLETKITADNVLHVGLGQYSKCTDSGNGYSTWINAGADLRFRLKNPDTNWRPYYAKGHSVSVKIYRAGFITTSKTELMFFVPLSKPIVGNPTVSVSSVDGLVVRQNGDYCFSKIISTDPVKPSSYTAAVVGGGCGINIKAKFSDTTNVTNNDACGVYASIKITFS